MLRKPTTSPAARLRAQVRRLEQRTAIAITGAASHLDHTRKHKPPRRDAGKKRNTALAHDTLVSNILQAWACDAEQGSNTELLLENPVGNLQH